MHLKEYPEFLLRLCEANNEALPLRFPDGPVSGIVHGSPKCVRLRPQIQTMPLGLLEERESLIGKRQAIMQAAHGNGTVLGQQLVDQEAPGVRVIDQRIAIIRKGQGHNPLSQNVRDPAEGNPGAWLAAVIENHVSAGLPAIRVRQHLNPARRVKNAAWSLLHEPLPQLIVTRIHTHDVQERYPHSMGRSYRGAPWTKTRQPIFSGVTHLGSPDWQLAVRARGGRRV